MSPCRYVVLVHPSRDGSNGRRAMPTIRSTAGLCSSVVTAEIPISPVGPVTATLIPTRSIFPQPPTRRTKTVTRCARRSTEKRPKATGDRLRELRVERCELVRELRDDYFASKLHARCEVVGLLGNAAGV